jgi:hypothetical protein
VGRLSSSAALSKTINDKSSHTTLGSGELGVAWGECPEHLLSHEGFTWRRRDGAVEATGPVAQVDSSGRLLKLEVENRFSDVSDPLQPGAYPGWYEPLIGASGPACVIVTCESLRGGRSHISLEVRLEVARNVRDKRPIVSFGRNTVPDAVFLHNDAASYRNANDLGPDGGSDGSPAARHPETVIGSRSKRLAAGLRSMGVDSSQRLGILCCPIHALDQVVAERAADYLDCEVVSFSGLEAELAGALRHRRPDFLMACSDGVTEWRNTGANCKVIGDGDEITWWRALELRFRSVNAVEPTRN